MPCLALAPQLDHDTLSLRVLATGVTDVIDLPLTLRGSAEWRPLVDMAYASSVRLAALRYGTEGG